MSTAGLEELSPPRETLLVRLEKALQYPYLWFSLQSAMRDLRERGTISEWVEFAFRSPFLPLQVRSEISTFIEAVAARKPQTVLEIGTERGGTLLLLMLAAAPEATVISVDMAMLGGFGGYPRWKGSYFQKFALASQQLHLLRANSHLLSTVQGVRSILGKRPLDLVFIDGDHSYGGVKADWELYGPLIGPDGMVAFHDVVKHPPEAECEVYDFWQELKKMFAHQEIVADSARAWGGIGVIWPRRSRGG